MQHIHNLLDLLLHNIECLYSAENMIQTTMPSLIKKVHHRSLKNALTHHAELTDEQKQRLEKIPGLINNKRIASALSEVPHVLDAKVNKGVTGLIEEAEELLSLDLAPDVRDAAIIACVQKIEHYEICTYGTALAYAKQLNLHNVELLLNETLNEEYDADDLLTALATAALNKDGLPEGIETDNEPENFADNEESSSRTAKVSISERTINSPGGRAGTSHRTYKNGESRGH